MFIIHYRQILKMKNYMNCFIKNINFIHFMIQICKQVLNCIIIMILQNPQINKQEQLTSKVKNYYLFKILISCKKLLPYSLNQVK